MQGRRNLFLLVASGCLIICALFVFYGYERTFRLWGVPVRSPHFSDLRVITGGAESHALGLDPLTDNPGDPWGRRMNYPRIWQLLFLLGINQTHTTFIGIIFIVLFICGIFLFTYKIDNPASVFLTAGIFSPAVLLGIERANNDLVVFFILSLSLFALRRSSGASMLLIISGFILKLYPIFGLGCLMREKKRNFLRLALTGIIIAFIYIGLTFDDLKKISEATSYGTSISYGVNVFWMHLKGEMAGYIGFVSSYILILLILIMSLWFNRHGFQQPIDKDSPYIDPFRLGSAIYIGTFMLGNNWDYRLMFLLFAIPQATYWAGHSSRRVLWVSRVTVLCIILSLWSLALSHYLTLLPYGNNLSYVLDQLSKWTVFAGLLYLFVYSLPQWLGIYITRLCCPKTSENTISY